MVSILLALIGWTIVQWRQDESINFYHKWIDYEEGFDDLSGEVWQGLSKVYHLTPNGSKTLKWIDM